MCFWQACEGQWARSHSKTCLENKSQKINPKRLLFGLASQSPGWEPKKIPPHSVCDIGSGICLEMVSLGFLKNIKVWLHAVLQVPRAIHGYLIWFCTPFLLKGCEWQVTLGLLWLSLGLTLHGGAGSPLTYWLSWVLLVLPCSSFLPMWLFPFPLGCLVGKHNLANAIFLLHRFQVFSNTGYCCALCVQQPQCLQSNNFLSCLISSLVQFRFSDFQKSIIIISKVTFPWTLLFQHLLC